MVAQRQLRWACSPVQSHTSCIRHKRSQESCFCARTYICNALVLYKQPEPGLQEALNRIISS